MNFYQRRRLKVVLLLIVGLLGIGFGGLLIVRGPSPAQLALQAERARLAALSAKERSGVKAAERLVNVKLPSTEGAPAPLTPAKLFVHPLKTHQVMGFVPYWMLSNFALGQQAAADVTNASVLIYSSVCVGAKGTLVLSGVDCEQGTSDLSSSAFDAFIQFAHAEGVRVLLSVQSLDPTVIHALASHPASSSSTLASAMLGLVNTYGFDGVNLDIEGRETRDREGYVDFVRDFSASMKRVNPQLELVVDTYPQSAASGTDFFDVAKIAKYVNEIFVMAYQMENGTHASANSPLASPDLGWSDVQTLVQYTKIVAAKKIILGLPFYGLNFVTKSDKAGAQLVDDAPGTRLYSDVLAAGRPALWDVSSETPYTVFRQDNHWREDWYDDPVSLSLKSALAQVFHIAGVGVWAMSQEGGDTQMLSAVAGESPPVRLPLVSAPTSG